MSYSPHTLEERAIMLKTIGAASVDDLFCNIDPSIYLNNLLDLPEPMSEHSALSHLNDLANKNTLYSQSYLGAGAYEHFIPSVVDALSSRGEFLTAYTPYQPEVSQGTLQAIYEFQTLMSELVGLDAANASMYDGATALVEALHLARLASRKSEVVVSGAINPDYLHVLDSYASSWGMPVRKVGHSGSTDLVQLEETIGDETAAVAVQSPNFFGLLEQMEQISELIKEKAPKALFIVCITDPLAYALLTPPGKKGADIVIGEAQSFGCPIGFGGPHLGFFATSQKYMKKMPGRLSGKTLDSKGREGFILTLQAREQHIRRSRASSNICSNQALMALRATIYMASLGKNGMRDVARTCASNARYLRSRLLELPGFSSTFEGEGTLQFFNEFTIRCQEGVSSINKRLAGQGILGGYDLGTVDPSLAGSMLLCINEMADKVALDKLISLMGGGGQ